MKQLVAMLIPTSLPAPTWLWGTFLVAVPILLALDLARPAPSPRQASVKTALLLALAAVFAVGVASTGGPHARDEAMAFVTAYLVELSLSVDNLFVFLLLFRAFSVPRSAIGKVLGAGIFGALVLRAVFIGTGLVLIAHFSWLFYVFGAILIYSGAKLLRPEAHAPADAPEPLIARVCRRFLPMASDAAAKSAPTQFFVREHGLKVTPLCLLLLAVEASDIVFALDSVPAGFAITTDGWLLFAANAWAILGLRALFVALDESLRELRFLRPALAIVLLLIGGKMLLMHVVELPMATSLVAIVGVLSVAVVASLVFPAPGPKKLP